jgi:hypothetical protein
MISWLILFSLSLAVIFFIFVFLISSIIAAAFIVAISFGLLSLLAFYIFSLII